MSLRPAHCRPTVSPQLRLQSRRIKAEFRASGSQEQWGNYINGVVRGKGGYDGGDGAGLWCFLG
jgi:hypothetical protein